jgi:hypothetical protein
LRPLSAVLIVAREIGWLAIVGNPGCQKTVVWARSGEQQSEKKKVTRTIRFIGLLDPVKRGFRILVFNEGFLR